MIKKHGFLSMMLLLIYKYFKSTLGSTFMSLTTSTYGNACLECLKLYYVMLSV